MTEDSALDEALQNLSSKKHTVSENARRAKEEKRFEGVEFVEEKKWYQKRTDIIDEFNILTSIIGILEQYNYAINIIEAAKV